MKKIIGIIIFMGFFSTMFGCISGDGRYVSEKAFQKNIKNQVIMTPQTLTQLRKHNVSDQTKLKLEYFFYTNTGEKASNLADSLTRKGYTADHGVSAGDKKLYIVTGWTTPMSMDESTVMEWTRQMCQIGYDHDHDCDFDGWGTNPDQD